MTSGTVEELEAADEELEVISATVEELEATADELEELSALSVGEITLATIEKLTTGAGVMFREQYAAPAFEKVPEGHATHLFHLPNAYVPAGQMLHSADPANENVPSRQGSQ